MQKQPLGELGPGGPASAIVCTSLGLQNFPWAWTRVLARRSVSPGIPEPPPSAGLPGGPDFPSQALPQPRCCGNRLPRWTVHWSSRRTSHPDARIPALTQRFWPAKEPHVLPISVTSIAKRRVGVSAEVYKRGISGRHHGSLSFGVTVRAF